ncbi:MAG: sigma-70 family RNA polymerase sigma factor [Ruminococcus flavefaciens]|nr:sigma-70 family RNA polymerase sigma factor [Ruminococcus flavefaciens]
MEDTEIVALLWQRRESALDEIMRLYGGMLRRFAGRILPTTQDAEECVNDALLDIWNTVPTRRPASVASYAAMLTRRRAIDRIRRLTAKKRGSGVYLVALDELEDCIPDRTAAIEATDDLREVINRFLSELSKEDRLLFMGRYFALESIADLAGEQGVTKNTVNVRLSRMRKKLKTELEERNLFI